MGVYALALSLSPAARARSWDVEYRWTHWLGVAVWAVAFWLTHRQLDKQRPERDPFLLPLAAMLSGWGVLTIWRLIPSFGLRQAAWLAVSLGVLVAGLRLPIGLDFLRRYKYIWLTSGLLLTAATLILGTNPMGAGPRLWLGCCGFYFQPSEPLKLLLIVYLAAYLADRFHGFLPFEPAVGGRSSIPLLPLLAPTLLMTGLALLLLVFQRDLGTASVFLFLYASVVYLATGNWRVVAAGGVALALAGLAGYGLFDVVRLRVDAWLNPWLEPSGRSFQIVQSLIAVASGGMLGRGPGMGNPGLVPVAQSDFIFAAIAEEGGLVGALGLILVLGLLMNRGLRAALRSADPFRRLLAAGLTAHLTAQSILIIGGNLRLLPLTGVTLPFVSYGGSSLLVAFLELLLLLDISASPERQPSGQFSPLIYRHVAGGLMLGLVGLSLAAGWWGYWRGPDLLTRTDNPRRAIADRYVQRGTLLDRSSQPLAESTGDPGEYVRSYPYASLGPVVGYTHPVYGQSGLEASLDGYLRGLQGNSGLSIWWNHLLYGQPPAGLDVRLSIDLAVQRAADDLLGARKGALVLLNAATGEVLAMASHPTFDANQLDETWEALIQDPNSPLLNRATMGLYPVGPALGGMLLAAQYQTGSLPETPSTLTYTSSGKALGCALTPTGRSWGAALAAGCPGSVALLGEALGAEKVSELYAQLGLYTAPAIRTPTLASARPAYPGDASSLALGLLDPVTGERLLVSPLQMALVAASLDSDGILPAARLALAVNTPQSGWVMLPSLSEALQVFTPGAASFAVEALAVAGSPTWGSAALALGDASQAYSWYVGGTLSTWPGVPLAVAVLVESSDAQAAATIGQGVLSAAMLP
jgi:cell division protein FtsW (lipid II flippase)